MLPAILIIIEILSLEAIRQHYYNTSRTKYYVTTISHVILSIWFWLLFFRISSHNTFFDTPASIWMRMNLIGMSAAVIFPRVILILSHFSGKLIRIKTGDHIRWLTNSALAISAIIFFIITVSTLVGRFNFKTEFVTINIKNLKEDLNGLKIIHLSDMHLAGFHHHKQKLQAAMDLVNSYEPDLVINTGDFVTYGWREFGGSDSILARAKGKYGNFAVLGNHDFGIYHPDFTEADRANNVLLLNKLIESSGYVVLNDEHLKIEVGDSKIGLIGVKTIGRHPDIYHGDLTAAVSGLDSVDLKILLSHDPNHWEEAVKDKTDINVTLSGHTHGMQMGIITKRIRWSPVKHLYPHWNGLFSEGDQFHYVNRGLGVLAIPFRIWMPPEITVITLARK